MTEDSSDNEAKDDAVGYGRPPKATRFVKGQSGNPSGRPRKGRSLTEILEAEFRAPVTVTENGRKRKIETRHAVIKQLKDKALRGDARAAQEFLKQIGLHDAKMEARKPSRETPPPRIVAIVRHMMTLTEGLKDLGILIDTTDGLFLAPSAFAPRDDAFVARIEDLNENLKAFKASW
jgi:hypothetical protein